VTILRPGYDADVDGENVRAVKATVQEAAYRRAQGGAGEGARHHLAPPATPVRSATVHADDATIETSLRDVFEASRSVHDEGQRWRPSRGTRDRRTRAGA
jgi:hypothetical protein